MSNFMDGIWVAGQPAPPAAAAAAALVLPPGFKELGWKQATNSGNNTLIWPHSVRGTPSIVLIYFSPTGDASAVYPLTWSWLWSHSGNPVTIKVTTAQVEMHIWAGAPVHGVYDAQAASGAGQWSLYSSGWFNVVVPV